MKALLSVLHFGLLRNFESVVRVLAERGHEVLLLADEPDTFGGERVAADLSLIPGVRWGWAPSYTDESWFVVARKLRQGLDYIRFLDPRYAPFSKLRDRLAERAPRLVTGLMRLPGMNSTGGRHVLANVLNIIERGMPRLNAMDDLLAREQPDVALFGSVTNPRATQVDHLRSARALGIPTGVCVYSWDHLSSKALIRVTPDRVFVWNDTQRREAVELHGISADRIVITGAQVYDQWFERKPSRTREAFLTDVGLPPDRPFVLYVCSALTPDPHESKFIRRWAEAIRRCSHPSLRDASLLIRPHPERWSGWKGVDWPDLAPVLIAGENPVIPTAKSDYFDALSYSTAVIGVVTSAFLEAAIAGRPVLTVTLPEFRKHQEGMLHFRYLLDIEGGLLKVAGTLDEHVRQLEAIFNGDATHALQQERFLRAFVRPFGLDNEATPRFVDMVETLAETHPVTEPAAIQAWQQLLSRRVVRSACRGLLKFAMLNAHEVAEERARRVQLRVQRREHRDKWRLHRRRKLIRRVRTVAVSLAQSSVKFTSDRRILFMHRSRKLVVWAQAGLRRLRSGVGTR